MELKKLMEARDVLISYFEKKLGGTLAYKIMKFLKGSEDEENFYTSKLKELLDEYSEKDTDGNFVTQDNNVKIREDKIQECKEAINALGNTEVTAPSILFELDEIAELQLSAKEAYALDDFIGGW